MAGDVKDTGAAEYGAGETTDGRIRTPWSWVPTLYFAEGIPYVLVMTVSVAMYKKFGVDNADIALFTSLLYLPWVIKPLWGPLVDLYWTKRNWSTWLQLLMGVFFLFMAFTLNTPVWWLGSLGVFTIIAFASATHDIAADGFYMLGLDQHKQTLFTGIRSTFYRISMIFGTGFLISMVGFVESHTGPQPVPIDVRSGVTTELLKPRTLSMPESPFIVVSPASPILLPPDTTVSVTLKLKEKPQKETVVSVAMNYAKVISTFFPVGNERMITADNCDRIVFTPENWDKEQSFVIKAAKDIAKVEGNQPVQAVFDVKAGNIAYSWMSCFIFCGLMFMVLGLWHMVILPRPVIDRPVIEPGKERVPFLRAAGGLLVGILILPMIACCGMYYGIAQLLPGIEYQANLSLSATAKHGIIGFICVIAVLLFFARWSKEEKKGISFFQASPIESIWAVLLMFATLFLMCKGAHPWVMSFVPTDTTIPKEVWTFTADFVIIILMALICTSRILSGVLLNALHGAAAISGMAFDKVFISFFSKPGILRMLAFLLLYRLGESMLLKLSGPFLFGPREEGSLGLTLAQYGFAYGTIGIIMLTIGGITGGVVAAKYGLKKVLWLMFATINLNHLLYVYLAYARPDEFWQVLMCVGGEQLGYGFGFTAYMIYMLYIAGDGEHRTSHFAICTGIMALGMMLPGMLGGAVYNVCKLPALASLVPAGAAADSHGYLLFFIVICLLFIPGAIAICFAPLDPEFGKKHEKKV